MHQNTSSGFSKVHIGFPLPPFIVLLSQHHSMYPSFSCAIWSTFFFHSPDNTNLMLCIRLPHCTMSWTFSSVHQERVFLSLSHKHLLCHLTAFSFHSPAAPLLALPHPDKFLPPLQLPVWRHRHPTHLLSQRGPLGADTRSHPLFFSLTS